MSELEVDLMEWTGGLDFKKFQESLGWAFFFKKRKNLGTLNLGDKFLKNQGKPGKVSKFYSTVKSQEILL